MSAVNAACGWGTRGDLRGRGPREKRVVKAPPRPRSPARLLSGASARGLAGGLRVSSCPASDSAHGKRAEPPARRPPPWTRARRLLRGRGGQREAPGPHGSRPGPEPVSPPPHASVRRRPGSSPQSRTSAPRPYGRGVRRPSPAATPLQPAPHPTAAPQRSPSRAGCTAAAAEVAALPPGGAGTCEGGAAAPGARPPDPGLGAPTSPCLRNPLCLLSPGTPSLPVGSDFARSS
uniref:Translation initiation factor IF-2-like n=1 Tax=Tursiops truncatus TaxID=9739 RepID=A0A6J3S8D8_TURTR|nr:translation initiation factor IF-2-like [Tursiops truncatus]